MCGYTRVDRIRNVVIMEKERVAPIEDKIRDIRLKWFRHIKRRSIHASARRYKIINLTHCRR